MRAAAALLLIVVTVATAADAASRRAATTGARAIRPEVLHLAFGLVGNFLYYAQADSRYLLTGGRGGVSLIDQRTGQTSEFDQGAHGSCTPGLLGGPWLLADCYPEPRLGLFSIANRAWHTVPRVSGAQPAAVGRDWIESVGSAVCRGDCRLTYRFENTRTGRFRKLAYREGATTIPNLDSPRLVGHLCAPLRVPRGPGPVTFFGRFAIAQTGRRNEGERFFLERCGSHLHVALGGAGLGGGSATLAASSNAVLWGQAFSYTVTGIFLPSLRRFTVQLPNSIDLGATGVPFSLMISSRRLYVLDGEGQLWNALLPSAP